MTIANVRTAPAVGGSAAAAAAGGANKSVELTFQQGSSNKFYRLALQESTLTITYGKIGTAGQTKVNPHASPEAALADYSKRLAEKLREGYAQSGSTSSPSAAAATVGTTSPRGPTTLAQWQALTARERQELLDTPTAPLRQVTAKTAAQLRDPKHRKFAEAMVAHVNRNADFENPDDVWATVGKPRLMEVRVVTLKSGEIAGGSLWLYQEGAGNDDQTGGHFASWKEAKRAGYEGGDINWQMSAIFDHEKNELKDELRWGWSGH